MEDTNSGKPVLKAKVSRRAKFLFSSFRGFVSTRRDSLTEFVDDVEPLSDEERDLILATKWGTFRTIINAIISAGVLGLAFRMKESGSVTVALLTWLSVGMVILTLNYLFQAGIDFNTRGYIPTVERAVGPVAGKAALITLSFHSFGTITAYFNVLRDSIPWVVQSLTYGCVEAEEDCVVDWYASSVFIIGLITAIFILPISCASDPDVFAKISFTTFVHFALFLCLVLYGMVKFGPAPDSNLPLTLTNQTGKNWPEDAGELLRFGPDVAVTMAVLAFALSSHTTAMTIFNGIRFNEQEKADTKLQETVVAKINAAATSAVYVYYMLIALGMVLVYLYLSSLPEIEGSFYIFGDDIDSNSLNSFPPDDPFAMVIRCTYFFEIGTSIPIFMYALRRNFIIPLISDDTEQSLDAFDQRRKVTKWVSTSVLLAGSFALAQISNLGVILSITGALFATCNVYIFPSLVIMHTKRKSISKIYLAPIVLTIGILCGSVALLKELDTAGFTNIFA